jgi:plasmid stability protein
MMAISNLAERATAGIRIRENSHQTASDRETRKFLLLQSVTHNFGNNLSRIRPNKNELEDNYKGPD